MNPIALAKPKLFDGYYAVTRATPLRHLHTLLRRRHHRTRYGVDSAFMFRAIELEINALCNRACPHCPNATSTRPKGYMSQALFDKIIGELAAIRFDGRVSYHFYGEPLLDKRLPEFVAQTKRQLPHATSEVFTNGDFLDLRTFRSYLARGLDNFLVTQHDSVMTPALQEILDQATPEERGKIHIRFASERKLINRSGLLENMARIDEPLRLPCDWPLTTLIVTHSGNVVLCCNDYFETEVLGNVAKASLREVWEDRRFVELRDALSRGDRTASSLCKPCDYVPVSDKAARIVPST